MRRLFWAAMGVALISMVFAGCNENSNVVDLGLPSGVKWTTCNLGAEKPWNYGNYYAWGETETKEEYNFETYKYSKNDAATAVLGSDYSTPSIDDWYELRNQCYWVWTSNYNEQGTSGYIVYKAKSEEDKGKKVYRFETQSASYSLSDTHIFLPAAGYRSDANLDYAGFDGYYWSSTLYEPDYAYNCDFSSRSVSTGGRGRNDIGRSIRPVRRPKALKL